MTKPYNYDLAVIDIFLNITLKKYIENLFLSPFWQNNTEVVN